MTGSQQHRDRVRRPPVRAPRLRRPSARLLANPGSARSSPTTWSPCAGPPTAAGTTRGWSPTARFTLDPATAVLHYGQEIFEGLKAYRQADGSIAIVPAGGQRGPVQQLGRAGWRCPSCRRRRSSQALELLVTQDRDWVPDRGREQPLPAAVHDRDRGRARRPSPASEYLFLVIASPAGAYFAGGGQAGRGLAVARTTPGPRPGGTGAAKCGGNYAAAFAGPAARRSSKAATRWSGSTRSSTAGSRRWAG